ncbi:MAG: hypothetical protein HYY65_01650, partial [Candidatus Tectomicrobia bacterium]|nr:hypothetical protein [Candidatus Tectomicrobia bacterium]
MVSQTERNQLLPDEWREGLDYLRLNEPIPEDLFLRLTVPAQPRTDAEALTICEELAVFFAERPLTWAVAEAVFEVPEGDRVGHAYEGLAQSFVQSPPWKFSDALLKCLETLVQDSVPGALDYPYPIRPEPPHREPETEVSPPIRSTDADTEIVLRQAARLAVAVISS